MKFFLYSLVGGLFMLAAVIGLWVVGGHTFDWQKLSDVQAAFDTNTARWLFLGFFIAFAVKAPFFPFHTWLPDAGVAAPAPAAALLVGVLDKVGTFGILRYCLPLFPEASRWFAPAALILGVIGIIYAALLAVGQNDLKRLVSYTSIAHFGFIGIGIFAFTTQAGTGSVLYMVNHGLATGLLFLVVGMFVARRGSALVSDFGGAGKLLPVLAGVLFFAGLASLALPGTAPFVSEFLVLIGTFTVHKTYAIIATVGIILAAAYVLWMVQRTTQGTLNPALTEVPAMQQGHHAAREDRRRAAGAPAAAPRLLPEAGHRCDQPGGPGDHAGRRHDRSGADGGRERKGGAVAMGDLKLPDIDYGRWRRC